MQIGVIGLGNIGRSLVLGLSSLSQYNFFIYDKNKSKLETQKNTQYIFKQKSNNDVLSNCSVVILCVRTDQVKSWLNKYSYYLNEKILILTQSGIDEKILEEYLTSINVIRVITNINICNQKGYTVILNNGNKNLDIIINIFNNLGEVKIVRSLKELNNISLITGCTPAFIGFMLSELLLSYDNLQLDKKSLADLLYTTIDNSLEVVRHNAITPNDYMNSACSKNGTLERCLTNLKKCSISNWLDPLKDTLKKEYK